MENRVSNISVIKSGLWTIFIISTILEMLLFANTNNLVGCFITFVSTWLFFQLVFKIEIIRLRPIAFIAFLQLFLFMYLPLPVTLMDGNEMSHDLYSPISTYFLQLAYFCTALLAFFISGKLYRTNKVFNILNGMGYFKIPSHRQLWLLGFIGLTFRFILMNKSGEGPIAGAGTLNMFSVLIYCPILILFGEHFGWGKCSLSTKYFIYLYVAFLCILLIATNSRSQMLSPLVVIVFCYLIVQIYSRRYKIWLTPKKFILIFLSVLFISGPASDMAIAMVVVRAQRSSVPMQQLLSLTFEAYNDKARLKAYRQMMSDQASEQENGEWVESYVSSPFLDRLCNYRVADLTIYHAEKVGLGNSKMLDFFEDRICTMYPGPIVNFLFPELDKSNLIFSPMDYLYYLSTGNGVFGFKVGGDVGLGLSTFGYFYFLLCLITYIFVFYITDAVAHIKNGRLNISIFTLISIYFTYFLIFQVGGGLQGQVSFILWSFWWTSLWYCITYKIVRLVCK